MLGFTRKFKPLELISESQVDAIWDGILKVMENTGIKFETEKPGLLKIFKDAGCIVDVDTKMVRFPKSLVLECLAQCPGKFLIEARDPKNNILLGGDRVYISSGPGMQYVDMDTMEPRDATRQEYYDAVTIYDYLPNFHIFHPLSPNSTFEGVPPVMHALEVYAAKLRNSTKAVWGGSSVYEEHRFTMAMDEVVGIKGLRGGGASIPPLGWDDVRLNSIVARVKEGYPSIFTTGPIWGASSPVTFSGAVISMSVEALGGIVLAQLIRPGHPVAVGTLAFPANMQSGAPLFGNIAIGLCKAVFSQVWRRYDIPTSSSGAAVPNSKSMDFQSGYEKGMIALANAICGDSMIWIHGGVYGELTAHPLQAIMDDDISGSIGRFLEGVEVDEETMALDLIEKIGAGPDFFLNKAHTRKWWRKNQYITSVADTTTLPEWIKGGKKSTLDLAKEKMEDILANHKVALPLTDSQEEEIERILKEAREFYLNDGK